MATPLKRPISPERPLLIIMIKPAQSYEQEAADLVRLWDGFDGFLQHHVTVQIEGTAGNDFERCETVLRYAAPAGIPITLQIQGDNGDRQDTMPPGRVRDFLDRYDNIIGLQIVEASQRTFVNQPAGPEYTMGRNARYARDIIELAGERGLFMSWQLMRDNWAAIGCSVDNEALFDTISSHAANVIPTHEMNCEFCKPIDHLGAMGLWMSGATAQWGVEAQSWYWSDCGYSRPGCCFPGTLDMPGGLYAIMFLLGAAAGASVYSIEPPKDAWEGPDAWRFTEHMEPLFRRLVTERLIPTREEMFEACPVAYHLPLCRRADEYYRVLEDLDFDHAEGRLMRAMNGVYDRSRDAELIPNDPRYAFIPVLPARTPDSVLDRFDLVLKPGDIESTEQARELIAPYFPRIDHGSAWSTRSGPLICAANTHENWYIPERTKLTVPRRPAGVRFDGAKLSWEPSKGDRAWNVWLLRNGVETRLTQEPLTEPSYRPADVQAGDRYAVSALTEATEVIEATLHLHDLLLFSARESRRSQWVAASGSAVERHRFGESTPPISHEVAARELRCAQCTPVEDLASPVVEADGLEGEVMAAMTAWKEAIEAEDVGRTLAWYASDYREAGGRTVESVRVALRCLLWSQLRQRFGSMEKEWGRVAAWRRPVVRLLTRAWERVEPAEVVVLTQYQLWAGAGSDMEPSDMLKLPFHRSNDMRMTWRHTDAGWRLTNTDPPFLQAEDLFPYRYTYQGW